MSEHDPIAILALLLCMLTAAALVVRLALSDSSSEDVHDYDEPPTDPHGPMGPR